MKGPRLFETRDSRWFPRGISFMLPYSFMLLHVCS
jgi:hypothetical protein